MDAKNLFISIEIDFNLYVQQQIIHYIYVQSVDSKCACASIFFIIIFFFCTTRFIHDLPISNCIYVRLFSLLFEIIVTANTCAIAMAAAADDAFLSS